MIEHARILNDNMMKKLFLISILCLWAITTSAQRCVVLDFQIGENMTAEEVDAVSYEFRSTFNPSCYTVEDYLRVKRVLKDLGYDPASMKKEQVRKFGRDMVATVVIYGSLSKFMDEYTLDVAVMDISTGTTLVSRNNVFQKPEYRTRTREVSREIATELCKSSSSGSSGTKPLQKSVPQGYTDLGLPSGTIWKNFNATGFYTYDEAVRQFGNSLPTKEQWEELKAECQWTWTGSGYKVTGPNGNSISLPAAGCRRCKGSVVSVGSCGLYWSSTPRDPEYALHLDFNWGGVGMGICGRCYGQSVRLVQD